MREAGVVTRVSFLVVLIVFPLCLAVSALAEPKTPLAEFHGTLKSITKNKILVVTPEEQVLIFRRGKRTRFLLDGKEIDAREVPKKSPVTVQAAPTVWGDPEAVNVIVAKEY
jgi:hypothetical protein